MNINTSTATSLYAEAYEIGLAGRFATAPDGSSQEECLAFAHGLSAGEECYLRGLSEGDVQPLTP